MARLESKNLEIWGRITKAAGIAGVVLGIGCILGMIENVDTFWGVACIISSLILGTFGALATALAYHIRPSEEDLMKRGLIDEKGNWMKKEKEGN